MRLKKNNNRKSKSVLRTWICSYMLVLLIIISLVFAANQVYRRFIIDSITQLKYLELANIQKSMDEIANNSKKAVLQIYGDRSISEIFKRGYSLESNRIRVKEIMVSMKHQMPAIDDFYIFMKDENLVLSSIGSNGMHILPTPLIMLNLQIGLQTMRKYFRTKICIWK